jgi:hypothetical protein
VLAVTAACHSLDLDPPTPLPTLSRAAGARDQTIRIGAADARSSTGALDIEQRLWETSALGDSSRRRNVASATKRGR